MKKISSSIIVLAVTVLISAGLAYAYVFLYMSLSKMKDDRVAFVGGIRDADGILKSENANSTTLSAYFVKDGGEASFVSSVEASCASMRLTCTTSSLNESDSSTDSIKNLNENISGVGSFNDINLLLKSFEDSPYPLLISHVSLTQENAATDEWRGTFSIEVPVLSDN